MRQALEGVRAAWRGACLRSRLRVSRATVSAARYRSCC